MTDEEKIAKLEAEVERLKAALEDVVFSARTKLSMKEAARKALYANKKG